MLISALLCSQFSLRGADGSHVPHLSEVYQAVGDSHWSGVDVTSDPQSLGFVLVLIHSGLSHDVVSV